MGVKPREYARLGTKAHLTTQTLRAVALSQSVCEGAMAVNPVSPVRARRKIKNAKFFGAPPGTRNLSDPNAYRRRRHLASFVVSDRRIAN